MTGIKNVFGGAGVRPDSEFESSERLKELFEILKKGDCNILDTARLYQSSEELLGKAGIAKSELIVDTKTIGGFKPGNGSRKEVLAQAQASKEQLGMNVDIFYIHAPDANTPIEETLAAVNEVFQSGFFKRFGLSNYKAEDVQKVYDHCKAKGYPLPAVYQGNYSAIARKQEELLFPTLRRLNMSFYAYSPLAGGFLTKTKQQVLDGAGRFDKNTPIGQMYGGMYGKPSYLEALSEWEAIAKEEGCSRADLAYRWVKYNSPLKPEHGDAIILGATRLEQIRETLASINKGPLSENAANKIDQIWKKIEHEAPLDNFHQ